MDRYALLDLQKWYESAESKPLVIRGARQVGKSTLVRIFCQNHGLDLLEVNLEKIKIQEFNNEKNFSIKKVLTEIELITGKKISEKTILFLDEAQEQPIAFNRLRYFYEDAPQLRVIAAGSLLDVILNQENFSMPVGRIEYYYLGPMSFREFLMAKGEELLLNQINSLKNDFSVLQLVHERAIELLKEYYFVGGMPEVLKKYIETNDMDIVRKTQLDLIQTYRDDIPKYTKAKQELRVNEVFNFVPRHLGEAKVKFSEIAATNSLQVKDAIDLLHRSQIIIKVLHTSASGLPLVSCSDPSVMKLFFLDVGLSNAILDIQWVNLFQIQDHELLTKGSMAEQFIAQHLNQIQPSFKHELFYWLRGGKQGAAEVDFVINLKGQIIPIEVKAATTGKMKSLWQFLAEKNSKLAIKFDLKHRETYINLIKQNVSLGNEVKEVNAKLIALPLYAVELLEEIIES